MNIKSDFRWRKSERRKLPRPWSTAKYLQKNVYLAVAVDEEGSWIGFVRDAELRIVYCRKWGRVGFRLRRLSWSADRFWQRIWFSIGGLGERSEKIGMLYLRKGRVSLSFYWSIFFLRELYYFGKKITFISAGWSIAALSSRLRQRKRWFLFSPFDRYILSFIFPWEYSPRSLFVFFMNDLPFDPLIFEVLSRGHSDSCMHSSKTGRT